MMVSSPHSRDSSGLNPYSNGITIEFRLWPQKKLVSRLNPYSNGITIEYIDELEAEIAKLS